MFRNPLIGRLAKAKSGLLIAWGIVFFFLLFNFKKYGITIVCMTALILMVPGTLIGLGLMNRTLGLSSDYQWQQTRQGGRGCE